MWPKALLELLPHLTRLVPMLNRYFQSRAAGDDAIRHAMERKLDDVATTLRKDINELSAALPSADLTRQMAEQKTALTEVAASLAAIRSQLEGVDVRLASLEKRSGSMASTVVITHILTLVLCLVLVVATAVVYLHK